MKNSQRGLQRLAVERVQDGVAGAVGGGAGALRDALAVVGGHAAERALVDLAFLGARERHAPMVELVDRGRRVAAQIFDRVLVAEPVGALDGVVHVPAPVVRPHVAERGGNAALRRHRVRAGREHFGDAGGLQARLRAADARAQARAAGADDHDVERVVDDRIGLAVDRGAGSAVGAVRRHGFDPRKIKRSRCAGSRRRRRGRARRQNSVLAISAHSRARAVDVVHDHRAHAEFHMVDARDQEQQHEDRRQRLAELGAHAVVVLRQQRQDDPDEGDRQRHERDRGQPHRASPRRCRGRRSRASARGRAECGRIFCSDIGLLLSAPRSRRSRRGASARCRRPACACGELLALRDHRGHSRGSPSRMWRTPPHR